MNEDLIRDELKRHNYNLAKVARSLGIDYQVLAQKFTVRIAPIIHPKGPMPEDISSLGRAGWERYVVAIKPHAGEWPMRFFNEINRARTLYDAGTHEMCQEKRSDGWLVLYCIPRKRKVVRQAYFALRRE